MRAALPKAVQGLVSQEVRPIGRSYPPPYLPTPSTPVPLQHVGPAGHYTSLISAGDTGTWEMQGVYCGLFPRFQAETKCSVNKLFTYKKEATRTRPGTRTCSMRGTLRDKPP